MKYRIASPGYETFTGDLGGVAFVDGVTAFPYPIAFIDRLAANFLLVDAETGDPVGLAVRLASTAAIPFEAPTELEQMTPEQIATANAAAARKAAPLVSLDKVYTQAELEAVADKSGIAGLREIAFPYGVKDKSISGLIEAILKAQDLAQSTPRPQMVRAGTDALVVPGVTQVALPLPGETLIDAVGLKAEPVKAPEAPAAEAPKA